jgi:hypothetical protein
LALTGGTPKRVPPFSSIGLLSRARPVTPIRKPIADIVAKYGKYNGWRKPEQLRPETYSILGYRKAEHVSAAWSELVVRANAIAKLLPPDAQSAN